METFEQLWLEAQQAVAAGHLQLNVTTGGRPKFTPPEPRALNVQPCGLTITAGIEVPAAELNALSDCQHCPYSDPSGVLRCPWLSTGYCWSHVHAYREVIIPASNPSAARWEFAIVILHSLGYDTSGM